MKMGGITRRWAINTFGVVFVLLLVVSVSVISTFRNHYYNAVTLKLKAITEDASVNLLSLYGIDSQESLFIGGSRYLEEFADKDKVGVWILDKSGTVLLSSNGFSLDKTDEMPDFAQAMQEKVAAFRPQEVTLPSGERAMTATVALWQTQGQTIGAVRYLISLRDVNAQIRAVSILVVLVSLLALLLVLISGSFFIRSIVGPIKTISETAQRIAGGDLRARIDHYFYDDELGALSATVNNMAQELERSDRVKNDFISTVSHELRTPLTAIRGWGETLLQVGDTDEVATKRGINVIISESTRLAGILEELLDFSRMQSGRLQMRMERMDLLAELDEVVFTMKERAIREGVELVYNVPHFPIPMNGDTGRIRQAFLNVLDNAIKYNEPGGKINVEAEIQGENLVEIAISDTGRGIAEKDLGHVKEKFYKADTSVRGSGIGLAVADEIMQLHGGMLKVASILGQGTTVTMLVTTEKITMPDEELPEEGETANEQSETAQAE